MGETDADGLSRRERQIMDIVYREGQASAMDVLQALPDPPSYSAVRALLRILESKGKLRHTRSGARYIFSPVQPRRLAAQSALRNVILTFFGGSVERAVATLLTESDLRLSDEELLRLGELIEQAKEGEQRP